jgi:protein subunit release factor B
MRIILYLLEYVHGKNPKSIRDIMVKLKSRSIYTMAKKGRHILEKVEKIPQKKGIISVGTVAAATVCSVGTVVCGRYL